MQKSIPPFHPNIFRKRMKNIAIALKCELELLTKIHPILGDSYTDNLFIRVSSLTLDHYHSSNASSHSFEDIHVSTMESRDEFITIRSYASSD